MFSYRDNLIVYSEHLDSPANRKVIAILSNTSGPEV